MKSKKGEVWYLLLDVNIVEYRNVTRIPVVVLNYHCTEIEVANHQNQIVEID